MFRKLFNNKNNKQSGYEELKSESEEETAKEKKQPIVKASQLSFLNENKQANRNDSSGESPSEYSLIMNQIKGQKFKIIS